MVRKQHSKTPNIFINTKKKVESTESTNIIQRLASPLGRFHSNHSTPRGSEKEQSEQSKHKRNRSTVYIPPVEFPKSDQIIDSSLDSCIIDNDSEISESLSQSENSTVSNQGLNKALKKKKVFRRKSIIPHKEDTPRLSGPEKKIENARKYYLKGHNAQSRKIVCKTYTLHRCCSTFNQQDLSSYS